MFSNNFDCYFLCCLYVPWGPLTSYQIKFLFFSVTGRRKKTTISKTEFISRPAIEPQLSPPPQKPNRTNIPLSAIHNCSIQNPNPDKTATGKAILLKHKIPKEDTHRNLKISLPNNQRKRQIRGKIIRFWCMCPDVFEFQTSKSVPGFYYSDHVGHREIL